MTHRFPGNLNNVAPSVTIFFVLVFENGARSSWFFKVELPWLFEKTSSLDMFWTTGWNVSRDCALGLQGEKDITRTSRVGEKTWKTNLSLTKSLTSSPTDLPTLQKNECTKTVIFRCMRWPMRSRLVAIRHSKLFMAVWRFRSIKSVWRRIRQHHDNNTFHTVAQSIDFFSDWEDIGNHSLAACGQIWTLLIVVSFQVLKKCD